MTHLTRSHRGVSERIDVQCVGVSRARNYLHQTGLEKVNFKFNFNELKFKQPYVASGSCIGL